MLNPDLELQTGLCWFTHRSPDDLFYSNCFQHLPWDPHALMVRPEISPESVQSCSALILLCLSHKLRPSCRLTADFVHIIILMVRTLNFPLSASQLKKQCVVNLANIVTLIHYIPEVFSKHLFSQFSWMKRSLFSESHNFGGADLHLNHGEHSYSLIVPILNVLTVFWGMPSHSAAWNL